MNNRILNDEYCAGKSFPKKFTDIVFKYSPEDIEPDFLPTEITYIYRCFCNLYDVKVEPATLIEFFDFFEYAHEHTDTPYANVVFVDYENSDNALVLENYMECLNFEKMYSIINNWAEKLGGAE